MSKVRITEKTKPTKSAICITLGEQSENHVGMAKQGNGLAKNGYSIADLERIAKVFESLGGKPELVNLNDENPKDTRASVLVLRNCIDILVGGGASDDMFNELKNLEWDKTYYDAMRKRWLNKRARYNLCFGENHVDADMEKRSGTIVAYDETPTMKTWKTKMEELCGEPQKLEAEGNFYYDANKTGIGFHGDGERKKVVAASLGIGVVREIHWQWFGKVEREGKKATVMPIGKRYVVNLYHGDTYIMSEKATGFDWKRYNEKTLRHAAGTPGSKYFKIVKRQQSKPKKSD